MWDWLSDAWEFLWMIILMVALGVFVLLAMTIGGVFLIVLAVILVAASIIVFPFAIWLERRSKNERSEKPKS